MTAILGVPTTTITAVVAAVFLGGLAILAVIGLRDRLLLRLALRNVPRRRAQSALISLGLALSTVIITTALNTGDTMSHTMRSLVAGTVGRADEIVVRPRRDARRIGFDNVQSVANGTFLTGTLQPFAQSEADRIQAALAGDDRVAGVAPAVVEQVTADQHVRPASYRPRCGCTRCRASTRRSSAASSGWTGGRSTSARSARRRCC